MASDTDYQSGVAPSGIEAIVCADITRRQAHGIAKYGTTVADNQLSLRAWLNHAYEETLDKAVYLRRAIAEIDSSLPELHLHVRTEYFEQIRAGTKTEEYRLHNACWIKRLVDMPSGRKRDFGGVVIYNGYKPGEENRLVFPWRGWRITGITHPHFGPHEVTVFAIKLDGENVQSEPR